MPTSVATVTTAFNALGVLPRQMDALRRQTRPLQEIIVVDNCSTDGTPQMLARQYPEVTVLSMKKNIGAAGAWAAGLEYAVLQKHHDWVCAFDDDSVPGDSVLQAMVEIADSNQSSEQNHDGPIGIIAALPVHIKTGTCYPPLLWREGFVRPTDQLLRQPLWFADVALASGSMVRRELVEKIGLPRSDFFMDFFDFEYCLRARAHGYRIAVATTVKLDHQVGNARQVRLPGYSRLWPNHAPWREYYISRNMAYAAWWLYPSAKTKRFTVRHLARHACGSLLFGSNKFACMKKMAQGFLDGRRARLGIRFQPSQS